MSSESGRDTGGLRGVLRRLVTDSKQRDNEELAGRCEVHGATKISACGDRKLVTVFGRIRSTTLRPRAGSPSLEAELWDGSGAVTLIWLGRRAVSGITPGQQLRATGRICLVDGRRAMYNPRYELLSAELSSD